MPLQGMEPGRLDRKITLQSRTVTLNDYNEPIESWATLAEVWANVDYPKTGSGESFYGALEIATTNTLFTIRYLSTVTAIERVLFDSDVYDIERIAEIGRRNFLQITAKRKE